MVTIIVNHVNHPPIANAGFDFEVQEGTINVMLNGTLSSDPDSGTNTLGDSIRSYEWKQTAGQSQVALLNNNSASPSL